MNYSNETPILKLNNRLREILRPYAVMLSERQACGLIDSMLLYEFAFQATQDILNPINEKLGTTFPYT